MDLKQQIQILEKENTSLRGMKSQERKIVIKKIITLILNELEEPGKGNLTTMYAIGILKEAIVNLEANALRQGVRSYLE